MAAANWNRCGENRTACSDAFSADVGAIADTITFHAEFARWKDRVDSGRGEQMEYRVCDRPRVSARRSEVGTYLSKRSSKADRGGTWRRIRRGAGARLRCEPGCRDRETG